MESEKENQSQEIIDEYLSLVRKALNSECNEDVARDFLLSKFKVADRWTANSLLPHCARESERVYNLALAKILINDPLDQFLLMGSKSLDAFLLLDKYFHFPHDHDYDDLRDYALSNFYYFELVCHLVSNVFESCCNLATGPLDMMCDQDQIARQELRDKIDKEFYPYNDLIFKFLWYFRLEKVGHLQYSLLEMASKMLAKCMVYKKEKSGWILRFYPKKYTSGSFVKIIRRMFDSFVPNEASSTKPKPPNINYIRKEPGEISGKQYKAVHGYYRLGEDTVNNSDRNLEHEERSAELLQESESPPAHSNSYPYEETLSQNELTDEKYHAAMSIPDNKSAYERFENAAKQAVHHTGNVSVRELQAQGLISDSVPENVAVTNQQIQDSVNPINLSKRLNDMRVVVPPEHVMMFQAVKHQAIFTAALLGSARANTQTQPKDAERKDRVPESLNERLPTPEDRNAKLAQNYLKQYRSFTAEGKRDDALAALIKAVELNSDDKEIIKDGYKEVTKLLEESYQFFSAENYGQCYEILYRYVILDKCTAGTLILEHVTMCIERLKKFEVNFPEYMKKARSSTLPFYDRLGYFNLLIQYSRNDDPARPLIRNVIKRARLALILEYKSWLITNTQDLCEQAILSYPKEDYHKQALALAKQGEELVPEEEVFKGIRIYVDCYIMIYQLEHNFGIFDENKILRLALIADEDPELMAVFIKMMHEHQKRRVSSEINRALVAGDIADAKKRLMTLKDYPETYNKCLALLMASMSYEFKIALNNRQYDKVVFLLGPTELGLDQETYSKCYAEYQEHRKDQILASDTLELIVIEIMDTCKKLCVTDNKRYDIDTNSYDELQKKILDDLREEGRHNDQVINYSRNKDQSLKASFIEDIAKRIVKSCFEYKVNKLSKNELKVFPSGYHNKGLDSLLSTWFERFTPQKEVVNRISRQDTESNVSTEIDQSKSGSREKSPRVLSPLQSRAQKAAPALPALTKKVIGGPLHSNAPSQQQPQSLEGSIQADPIIEL